MAEGDAEGDVDEIPLLKNYRTCSSGYKLMLKRKICKKWHRERL